MKRLLILSLILSSCTKLYYISNKTSLNQPAHLIFQKESPITADNRQFSTYSRNKIIHNLEVSANDTSKIYAFELAPNTRVNLSDMINVRGYQTNKRFQLCLSNQCEFLSYPVESKQAVLRKTFLLWKIYEFQIKDPADKR